MKKGNLLILGMLVMAIGLVLSGCATSSGDGETETRTFPDRILGDWIKDSGSYEIGFFIHNEIGRLRLPFDENSVLEKNSGNSYTLSPTSPNGGRYSMNYSFTATISTDGKLTISGAKEIPIEDRTVSMFTEMGASVNDLNGTYTKK